MSLQSNRNIEKMDCQTYGINGLQINGGGLQYRKLTISLIFCLISFDIREPFPFTYITIKHFDKNFPVRPVTQGPKLGYYIPPLDLTQCCLRPASSAHQKHLKLSQEIDNRSLSKFGDIRWPSSGGQSLRYRSEIFRVTF